MAAEEIIEIGSRPMPEFVRRGLVVVQGRQRYLKAAYRVLWMRSEHSDWSIETEIVHADYERGHIVVRASIRDGEGRTLATAHSEETRGKFPPVQKAETGAVARALGMVGYGTQFGELDEEEVSERENPTAMGSSAAQSSGGRAMPINTSDGPCVSCNAPAGKPHGKNCKVKG